MIPEKAKHLYDLPVPDDAKAANVMHCDYCHGPVDRLEHMFQCRNKECGAVGDLITGIMTQVNPEYYRKAFNGDN